MQYTVLEAFFDRTLKKLFAKGDIYPGNGAAPGAEWIRRLETSDNRCGRPFIKRLPDEAPKETPSAAKKRKAASD